jgi:hypothetical protein
MNLNVSGKPVDYIKHRHMVNSSHKRGKDTGAMTPG